MTNQPAYASRPRGSRLLSGMLLAVAFAISSGAGSAWAREARPWLCRTKPVFSGSHPMVYTANGSSGRWRLTFMSFDPSGGHDGFTVVDSRDLGAASHVDGQLDGGTYFVVAQYAGDGGAWICPSNIRDHDRPAAGEITKICFGSESSDCGVELAVRPAAAAGH